MQPNIEIVAVDPREPSIRRMIAELDTLMSELYPAESNHLTDPDVLAAGANRFFGVKVDDAFRGCGAILVVGEEYAEVKRIYVDPTARGLGLAKAICTRLEREARLLGLAAMKLETGIHQPDAIGLFKRFGFEECTAFGDYPADDPFSVYLEKRL